MGLYELHAVHPKMEPFQPDLGGSALRAYILDDKTVF
jgi:hypothetical protein